MSVNMKTRYFLDTRKSGPSGPFLLALWVLKKWQFSQAFSGISFLFWKLEKIDRIKGIEWPSGHWLGTQHQRPLIRLRERFRLWIHSRWRLKLRLWLRPLRQNQTAGMVKALIRLEVKFWVRLWLRLLKIKLKYFLYFLSNKQTDILYDYCLSFRWIMKGKLKIP